MKLKKNLKNVSLASVKIRDGKKSARQIQEMSGCKAGSKGSGSAYKL